MSRKRPTHIRMVEPPSLRSSPILWLASAWLPVALFAASASGQAGNPAAVGPTDIKKAEEAYVSGARLLERADLAGAQDNFARAAHLNPARLEYGQAFVLTREHRVSELVQGAAKAQIAGRPEQATLLMAQAKAIDPSSDLVLQHLAAGQSTSTQAPAKAQIKPADPLAFAGAIEVHPNPGRLDFDLRGTARQIVPQVATAFGLKAVLDSGDTGQPQPEQPLHFVLQQATYAEAMPMLLKMGHLFAVPVDRKLLLVARDSQETRARLERQIEESIYVPASTAEQLNELTNVIKNVFDVKQVVVGATSGTIVVRAPVATLKALNETLEDLIDGAAEVVLEIKLVSIDKSRTVNTGTQTPTSAGAFSVYGEAESIVNANQQLVQTLITSGGYVPTGNTNTDILNEALYLILSGAVQDAKLAGLIAVVGNGLTSTGLFIGSGATVNFALNTSDVRALDDLTVRVGDRQATTLRVGERYPITTATYSSGISSATKSALSGVTINGVSANQLLNQYLGSSNASTIPQVQFEDLGLTLKTTPSVLRSGLVDIKIELKIEALTGQSANNIPVLTSRDFVSDITIADGASAVMLSDLSRTESAAISGLPGLSELPGFQQSAADDLRERATSELMLLVTPHVVRHRKTLTASRRIPFSTSVPQEF